MLDRFVLGLAVAASTAIAAQAQSFGRSGYGIRGTTPGVIERSLNTQWATGDFSPDKPVYYYAFSQYDIDQIRRWGKVGRCVAAADREGSIAFATAPRGTPAWTATAREIDPAFDSCFVRSGVFARTNGRFRRATVADALGVRLAASR